MNRRMLLKLSGLAAVAGAMPALPSVPAKAQTTPVATVPDRADYTIRIGNGLVELAPDRIVSTTTYNGQFPGPLLRFNEGRRVVIDIHNDTGTPEQLRAPGDSGRGCVR